MQRLRLKFSRGEEIKFISHLDITRLWERALRRTGVPLAYSQGFSPHPQIALAVPLSVGMTSEAELMDITSTRNVTPQWLTDMVNQQLPPGIRVLQTQQISPTLPALQAQVRFAEYRVAVKTDKVREEIESAIKNLLALKQLPWQHQRDTGVKNYDLRALIDTVQIIDWQDGVCTLSMRLRCDNMGSGRPEQVTMALGFSEYPELIHRTKLILETAPPGFPRQTLAR
jgi:radical SAM-linked protein